jgi:ATP-dependent RNA helicase DBP3
MLVTLSKPESHLPCSATWPKEIRELAHEFLSDPVRVTIGSEDLTASDSITQIVEVIDMQEKDKRYGCFGLYHLYASGTNGTGQVLGSFKKVNKSAINLFPASVPGSSS